MVFSAGGSQRDIVAWVEDNSCFGEYGIVLNFCFTDSWAIVGENDEFSVSVSEGSKGGLISQDIFSTLDDETESAVDVLSSNFFSHCFNYYYY